MNAFMDILSRGGGINEAQAQPYYMCTAAFPALVQANVEFLD